MSAEAFNPVLAVLRIRDALQGVDGYELDAEIADCEALLCFLFETAAAPAEPVSPEERKRAAKAARQRRWRAQKASTDASRVDDDVDTAASTQASTPPSRASHSSSGKSESSYALRSISDLPESDRERASTDASTAPSTQASTPKPKKWRRFPADYVPSEGARELARSLGVDVDAALAEIRDHEYRDPKSDPEAAFRTWIRNSNRFGRTSNPAANAKPVRGALAPVSKSFAAGRVDMELALREVEQHGRS